MSPGGCSLLFRALPAQIQLSAEEKRNVRTFARNLSARVAKRRAFACVITDDTELRRLNNAFLGRDYATDVLSFPSRDSVGELGEMAISVERAESQALEFGHHRTDEICILMLHGLLHLAGLDHEKDLGQMAGAEREWREEFGLPMTLIARSAGSGLIR